MARERTVGRAARGRKRRGVRHLAAVKRSREAYQRGIEPESPPLALSKMYACRSRTTSQCPA